MYYYQNQEPCQKPDLVSESALSHVNQPSAWAHLIVITNLFLASDYISMRLKFWSPAWVQHQSWCLIRIISCHVKDRLPYSLKHVHTHLSNGNSFHTHIPESWSIYSWNTICGFLLLLNRWRLYTVLVVNHICRLLTKTQIPWKTSKVCGCYLVPFSCSPTSTY